jgi:hypothetical protein
MRTSRLPARTALLTSAGILTSVALTFTTAVADAAPRPALHSAAPASGAVQSAGEQRSPVPLMAFYYSWFDTTSWRRAKNDYPLLGRYTSDDPTVMRQHVRWAKAAGIDGFIVSWKDTPTNDRRLSLLMQVARAEDFKLAMIYQGLDFERRPLPVERVAADLRYFETTYAPDTVFLRLGGKPLTVWSGTWAYSHAEVARAAGPVRDTMTVLNTEKNLAGYTRLADITDGDAYYWSSVNPETNTNYAAKLEELSRAIHARGDYWMAPFAPGFDARKVGGTRSVERHGGATLRTEYATAVSSSPDVLGLISWNEFSENSYVEPSKKYGHLFLDVLADLRHAKAPAPAATVDSSEPAAVVAESVSPWPLDLSTALLIVAGALLAFFGGLAALRPLVRRRDEELGLLTDPGDDREDRALPRPHRPSLPDPEDPTSLHAGRRRDRRLSEDRFAARRERALGRSETIDGRSR